MTLPYDEAYDLIVEAEEQKRTDKLYARWISGYDKSMSWAEFKRKAAPNTNRNSEPMSVAKTLEKVKEILQMRF